MTVRWSLVKDISEDWCGEIGRFLKDIYCETGHLQGNTKVQLEIDMVW